MKANMKWIVGALAFPQRISKSFGRMMAASRHVTVEVLRQSCSNFLLRAIHEAVNAI